MISIIITTSQTHTPITQRNGTVLTSRLPLGLQVRLPAHPPNNHPHHRLPAFIIIQPNLNPLPNRRPLIPLRRPHIQRAHEPPHVPHEPVLGPKRSKHLSARRTQGSLPRGRRRRRRVKPKRLVDLDLGLDPGSTASCGVARRPFCFGGQKSTLGESRQSGKVNMATHRCTGPPPGDPPS